MLATMPALGPGVNAILLNHRHWLRILGKGKGRGKDVGRTKEDSSMPRLPPPFVRSTFTNTHTHTHTRANFISAATPLCRIHIPTVIPLVPSLPRPPHTVVQGEQQERRGRHASHECAHLGGRCYLDCDCVDCQRSGGLPPGRAFRGGPGDGRPGQGRAGDPTRCVSMIDWLMA